jgi:succinyl-diaminopimelate desuccinylase
MLRDVIRAGDAIIAAAPADGRPVVTLVGHLDTVPAQGNASSRVEDGRLHGLGASDMKGGLAVMMALAGSLPDDAPLALGLVFYPAEEGPIASNGLGPVLARKAFPPTDLAVILEPTDLAVQLGCLGTINAEVVFTGEAAHSARPWLGRNAIHMGGKFLVALNERAPRKVLVGRSLVYREVISATTASGGQARNVVPSEFRLNINMRFAPGRTLDDAQAELEELASRYGGETTVVDAAPAGPLCEGNALLARLTAQGLPIEPKQAWTDVAQLGAAGIDAVNFGPGETALAHRPDESIALDALDRCYDALYKMFTSRA